MKMNSNFFFESLALISALTHDENGYSYLNEDPFDDPIFQKIMEGKTNDSKSEKETC